MEVPYQRTVLRWLQCFQANVVAVANAEGLSHFYIAIPMVIVSALPVAERFVETVRRQLFVPFSDN